uniref:OTU domain-containing protein n=1 Tax=Lygus hesperus TaxID=30085 RepID=A0A146L0V6_LYGHE
MVESKTTFEDALTEVSSQTKRSKRILKNRNSRLEPPVLKVLDSRKKRVMSQNDSDDDFEIVCCIDAIKWFYPIDKNWQRSKCEKFQLSLKKELDFKYEDPVPATAPMEIYEIEGDGNCYFRCLSYLITGTDKSHRILRQKLVKFMRENEKMVEGLGGRNYLDKSLMWTEGMWPTEVEIYVSACMLDTDIYTYMDGKWLRFSSSGKLEISDKVDRAIYLQNKENVHYDVVVQVQEPKLLPPSRVYGSTRSGKRKLQPVTIDVEKIVESTPPVALEIPSVSTDTQTLDLPRIPFGPKRRLDISVLNDIIL